MANPWDADEVIQPAAPSGAMPWDQDEVVPDSEFESTPERPPLQIEIVGGQRENPTEGMGQYDRYLAGLADSVVTGYKGLKQLGTEGLGVLGSAFAGSPEARKLLQQEYQPTIDAQRQDVAEYNQLMSPLRDTGMGMLGNVVGTVGQIMVPGAALRGTGAGAALLPATIRGNALQGAAFGAAQPVTEDGERLKNAGLGGALGAAGSLLVKAPVAAYNALRNLGSGAATVDRAAANTLTELASDPAAIGRAAPSAVPNVTRSLAEESLDPGIARLERNLRSTSNEFDAFDRSNNAARVAAIEQFAGDPASLAAARQARTQQTSASLNQAMQDKGVDVAGLRGSLQAQYDKAAGRSAVQRTIQDVQTALDDVGDDVFGLYNVRKTVDDLLTGKAGTDKSYAKAASRELMQFKTDLDQAIAKVSPSFGDYLSRYQQLSVPINRMQVGQALMSSKSGGAVLDPVTGAQVLTPAQFSKASRSLDDIAAKATGFKKAKADQILTASDISVIKAIQDDLERQAFRATAGSGGNSQTFERLALDQQLGRRVGGEIAGRIPVVGSYIRDFTQFLDKTRNDRVKERLAYLVANPEEARRVIATLPPAGQRIVTQALTQLGGAGGTMTAVQASNGP